MWSKWLGAVLFGGDAPWEVRALAMLFCAAVVGIGWLVTGSLYVGFIAFGGIMLATAVVALLVRRLQMKARA